MAPAQRLVTKTEKVDVPMKLLLWIGNAPQHIALANVLQENFNVVGVILETRPSRNKSKLSRIRKRLSSRRRWHRLGNPCKQNVASDILRLPT